MTIDVAAGRMRPDAQRTHFGSITGPVAYRARAIGRQLSVRHTPDGVVVRDAVTQDEGSGPTYLDALRALNS